MNPSSVRKPEDINKRVRAVENKRPSFDKWYTEDEDAVTKKHSPGSYFIPSKGYVITPMLMYVNALIFLTTGSGSFSSLLPVNTTWLFLSNTFIHVSIVHLLVNMYGLCVIGRELEPVIGPVKFLGIYFFSAWIATFNSMLWNDMNLNSGTGGAIFGLYGCYIGLLIVKLVRGYNKDSVFRTMIILTGYNLAIGFMGNFDTAANVGGLLYGALIGVLGGTLLVQRKNVLYKSIL